MKPAPFTELSEKQAQRVVDNLNNIDKFLFQFYRELLRTEINLLVYPFAAWDVGTILEVGSDFKKRILIDHVAYLPESDSYPLGAQPSEIKAFAKEYDVILVNHNLKKGLPMIGRLCKDTDGAKIYEGNVGDEVLIEEEGIDLLVLRGYWVREFDKFHKDVQRSLNKRSLIAMRYRRIGTGDAPDDVIYGEGYNLPQSLRYGNEMQDYTLLCDFRLPADLAKHIQQTTGKPVKYLNQLGNWYFFCKKEK